MASTVDTSLAGALAGTQPTVHQPAGAVGSSKLGKDEFIKLLTEQLKCQDPTQPLDSNAFVAQLAQFSSLEQMQNANTTLQSMLTLQKSSGQNAALGMVGKEAVYKSDEITLDDSGTATAVSTKLTADAGDVTMTVTDSDGTVVRRQSFGPQKAGDYSFTWDGKDDTGSRQEKGTYTATVTATDVTGDTVTVEQQSTGRITGVSLKDSDNPELLVGTTRVKLSDVLQIQEAQN